MGEQVTEVTAEPRVTRTTGLALWQPQLGTICASSRTQESISVQLLARAISYLVVQSWRRSLVTC